MITMTAGQIAGELQLQLEVGKLQVEETRSPRAAELCIDVREGPCCHGQPCYRIESPVVLDSDYSEQDCQDPSVLPTTAAAVTVNREPP